MAQHYLRNSFLVLILFLSTPLPFLTQTSFAQDFRKPNFRLEVKINDKIVAEKSLVSIKLGEKVQLQVSKKRKSGSPEDITADENIKYQVLTPWSLTVSPEGLVESKYPSRKDNIPANDSSNHGLISITYGKPEDKDIGSQFVNFFVDFSGNLTSQPVNETSEEIDSPDVDERIEDSKAAPVSEPFDFSIIDPSKGDVPADILESLKNPEIENTNPFQINDQDNGADADNSNPAVPDNEHDPSTKDPASEDSTPENQPVDFIDYDQLRKIKTAQESNSLRKPYDPSLELTPEERRLYDDALKQP